MALSRTFRITCGGILGMTLHRCLKQIPRLRFAPLGMTPGRTFRMAPSKALEMTCGRRGIALTTASTVAPARGRISVRTSSTLCRRRQKRRQRDTDPAKTIVDAIPTPTNRRQREYSTISTCRGPTTVESDTSTDSPVMTSRPPCSPPVISA